MPYIIIILASIREGRTGEKIAQWVAKQASERADLSFELIDLLDWPLPLFSSKISPMSPDYKPEGVAAKWSEKITSADGYIIVTPEYNHSFPGALKNAMDHLFREWGRKPIAFVSYGGSAGGARAVEQLRLVAVELQMAPIRSGVHIGTVWGALEGDGTPKDPNYTKKLSGLFDQLGWWTNALKDARAK